MLNEELVQFYQKYQLPENGGVNDKTFGVPLPFFTLILPNFNWRRKKLHIHDLEHILHNQNTTWKGETFIASWEIATGFWRYFPLFIFPLWTMGFGLFSHPDSVLKGFMKGRKDCGIASLNIERDVLLSFTLEQLQLATLNKRSFSKFRNITELIFWCACGLIVFLSPILLLLFLFLII